MLMNSNGNFVKFGAELRWSICQCYFCWRRFVCHC